MNYLPLFIGLPGSGKSTFSKAFGQAHRMPVVETDVLFRQIRGLSPASMQPEAEIMRQFLAEVRVHPYRYTELERDANTLDKNGLSALADGRLFRSHGEDLFRRFEVLMLRWLHDAGRFEQIIVDLSASAPLFRENQTIFNKRNGFVPILLRPSDEMISKNLLDDYEIYKQTKCTKRGAFETEFDALGPNASNADITERALELTRKVSEERIDAYIKFATRTVTLEPNMSAHELICLIDDILSEEKGA